MECNCNHLSPRAQRTIVLYLILIISAKEKGISNSILSNDTPFSFTSVLFKIQINIHLE